MGIIEIIITSVGLAMDAFATSICKGLAMKKMKWQKAGVIGIYFGLFQGLMPLLGYLLGSTFGNTIVRIDHWIAFLLLGLIGINMLTESLSTSLNESNNDEVDFKVMLPLAIATSIDALAVGITFAFLKVNIIVAVLSIGTITCFLSIVGVKIGNVFGNRYEKRAQLIGGIILILMGLKILLEHLRVF